MQQTNQAEIEMNPNGMEPENRKNGFKPGPQDANTSGFDASTDLNDILSLSETLSRSHKRFALLRTRGKKRILFVSAQCGRIFKRWLDVCGSLAAIILLLPLLLLVAVWIKLDSPGPVIYRQVRVGLYGRPFYFYKFRSMYTDSEARRSALESKNESKDGVLFKLKNDPRITRCFSAT